MTGPCISCGFQTISLRGPQNNQRALRPAPGWRKGYIIENANGRRELTCLPCLVNHLPANIAA